MKTRKSTELREQALEKLKAARAVTEGKATISADEQKQVQTLMDAHDALVAEAENYLRIEDAEAKHGDGRDGLPPSEGGSEQAAGDERPLMRQGPSGEKLFSRPDGSWVRESELPFKTIGDQLAAVRQRAIGRGTDPRFDIMGKALGLSEGVFGDGGATLQPNFVIDIMTKGYAASELASRCRPVSISQGNSTRILGFNETSRADGSRFGGMQAAWTNEGVAVTASKPKFTTVDLQLRKLMLICYATDEMVEDQAQISSIVGTAAAEELSFQLNGGIYSGIGGGAPLGCLNAPAAISVAAEGGQAADTVVAQNVSKMWARCWAPARANAIWVINQDVEPQLDALAVVVGVGGLPVYMPPGGLADSPYGRLKGRPVIIIEQAETLGDKGDIGLIALSQYYLANKGGIRSDASMHVAFLTDETAFRFILRADGAPAWKSALTPAKGTNTLSPFVFLAAR